MAILIVNCGSSSLKLSLFEDDECTVYAHLKGNTLEVNGEVHTGYTTLSSIFDFLQLDPKTISAIGHRFVHGGSVYTSTTLVTPKVLSELEKLIPLAPLHNGYCLDGIKACLEYFGKEMTQLLVFDTAFHSHMPACASQYALPAQYGIKRYGFHGISHAFLWKAYAQYAIPKSRVITLHLGNGCSMAAIKEGVSLDTSMGFSPLEGLVMATRTGDIDAAVVDYLCQQEKKSPEEIINIFNFESGLLGVSRISWSMEELVRLYDKEPSAKLAIDLFCYRVLKYIGAYIAVLGGVDALIFSGGIGENSAFIRKKIIQSMSWFGIGIDDVANDQTKGLPVGGVREIQAQESTIPLFVIATDENQAIAKEVASIISPNCQKS